jgi:hypothetical protein
LVGHWLVTLHGRWGVALGALVSHGGRGGWGKGVNCAKTLTTRLELIIPL